jgi:hypothetical protein
MPLSTRTTAVRWSEERAMPVLSCATLRAPLTMRSLFARRTTSGTGTSRRAALAGAPARASDWALGCRRGARAIGGTGAPACVWIASQSEIGTGPCAGLRRGARLRAPRPKGSADGAPKMGATPYAATTRIRTAS